MSNPTDKGKITDAEVEAALTAKPFGAATVRSFIGAGAHDEEVPAIMRAALFAASRVRTAEPVAWSRDDMAEGLAQLDNVQLPVRPRSTADWRKYRERADDLMAQLSLSSATPVPSYADAIRDAAKVAATQTVEATQLDLDASATGDRIVAAIEALSRAPQ